MKKLILIAVIASLLPSLSFSQPVFKVTQDLKISNGDTNFVDISKSVDYIYFTITKNFKAKLYFFSAFGGGKYYHQIERLKIIDSFNTPDGGGYYLLYNRFLGTVELEIDLEKEIGQLRLERNDKNECTRIMRMNIYEIHE